MGFINKTMSWIIKIIFKIFLVSSIFINSKIDSFNLVENYNYNNNIIEIYPCIDALMYPNLIQTTHDVIDSLNDLNHFRFILYNNPTNNQFANIICVHDNPTATYFSPLNVQSKMSIFVNRGLLYNKNTLYNVILHEMGHVMGLDHSTSAGMMAYHITEDDIYTSFLEDNMKLWLSPDDIAGVIKSLQILKIRKCSVLKNRNRQSEYFKCLTN